MKQISQEEFERCIEMLVDKKITKVKLAKELETDPRTLDNRIQELVVFNPELYGRYLEVMPYKQRTLTHIDFEALVIHMLKQELTVDEAASKYDISPRTIRRRINELENTELVELYREVADNRKHRKQDSIEIREKIELLEERQFILGGINDKREQELLKVEAEYYKLCQTMGKREAAIKMGYGDRDRVFKLLNELYKIKIEKKAKEEKNNESKVFRDSLKVEEGQLTEHKEDVQKENNNIKSDLDIEDGKVRGE